ncbi:MAG: GTP 3',8-cyclase MoaA [Pseudomonadota bacterium]
MVNTGHAVALNDVVTDTRGRPLRDLRLSVIDQCNFRCRYCMPAEIFHEHYEFFSRAQRLSNDETVTLVAAFAQLGVNKLRITGGEPLLRKDLPDLLGRLFAIEGIDDIAMSTNGVLLPRAASDLKAAGLDRVTISLDSMDSGTFKHMSGGRGSLEAVLAGLEAALAAGFDPVKVNAVIERDRNEDQILPLAERFRHSGCVLRFIEFMDVGTRNAWRRADVVSSEHILKTIDARWPLEPVAAAYRGEVARRYRYADGAGEVGFITSITQPFCQDCTRARLSADGHLFTCLFSSRGHDLKTALRAGATPADLAQQIQSVWTVREDAYSETRMSPRANAAPERIEMFRIGG